MVELSQAHAFRFISVLFRSNKVIVDAKIRTRGELTYDAEFRRLQWTTQTFSMLNQTMQPRISEISIHAPCGIKFSKS